MLSCRNHIPICRHMTRHDACVDKCCLAGTWDLGPGSCEQTKTCSSAAPPSSTKSYARLPFSDSVMKKVVDSIRCMKVWGWPGRRFRRVRSARLTFCFAAAKSPVFRLASPSRDGRPRKVFPRLASRARAAGAIREPWISPLGAYRARPPADEGPASPPQFLALTD